MFQKNISAIKLKNPALAAKLESLSIDNAKKDIEVIQTESKDLILSYKNNLLSSAVDPIREAKATWNRTITGETAKNDIIVVFGLGMGYLFKRAFISSNSKIFIIEPFLDVLRFVFEYVDLSNELAQDRIYITDNIQDIISKIESEFLASDRVEFLFLNPTAILAKDTLADLVEKTLHVCSSKISDQNTIFNMTYMWTRNSILNMSNLSEARPAGFYENSFNNKPCLILSAGPSLVENLDTIKKYKDKFITIAVLPAYKTLIEAGIVPDFVTCADPESFTNHIKGLEETLENVNIVMGTRADNDIFSVKTASKILYFADVDPIATTLANKLDDNIGLYKSGGTVSILSYYFAKALGCDPITFVGLDLSFIDNKIYADGRELEIYDNDKVKALCPGTENPEFKKSLTYVKDINGNMIPSRDDYALFIRQFEDICANEVHPRIINTTAAGAYIAGMEYIKLDELIKSLELTNINSARILSDIYNQTADKWMRHAGTINQELCSLREKVSVYICKSKNLSEELQNILGTVEDKENMSQSLQKYDAITNELVSLRNELMNNSYLANLLQAEIWKYSKSYKISTIPNIEEIISNLKLELHFYTEVNKSCKSLLQWLNKALQNSKSEVLPVNL